MGRWCGVSRRRERVGVEVILQEKGSGDRIDAFFAFVVVAYAACLRAGVRACFGVVVSSPQPQRNRMAAAHSAE